MAAEDDMCGDETQNSGENVDTIADTDIFTVEVLQIIKEAQQQHGLRHGDFQRYRGYCSRRIKRIRKSLHFPQGDKRRVNPKKINMDAIKDVRYLHLPLFSAERAWAYAMQLKSEANTEPRKRFHMISKLKKAVVYAEETFTLCEHDKCDARTKLESQAYRHYMRGSLEFELEKWKPAIESYSSVKTIYENLAKAFTEDIQALYLQRVSEIEPNIRYCAYNIGDETAIEDLMQMRREAGGGDFMLGELDTLLSQTREKQAATLSEVTWQGRTVPVKSEPVRLFLLNLQESGEDVEKSEGIDNKISIYESILKQCIDAQQFLRDSLQEDQNFKLALRGQAIEGKVSNAHYLHSYLTFIKLSKTIDRNLLLIDNLKLYLPGGQVEEGRKITKPQDLVRLYDIIIQNLGEIPNLDGIEDDESLSEEMSTRALGFKAFRCFYIAQSYGVAKKWKEAIGLYDRVLHYAQEAIQKYKQLSRGSLYKADQTGLEELIKEADSLKYSCHASSILDTETLTDQVSDMTVRNNKPLMERLDQYAEDSSLTTKKAKLVSFPPDFKPIPCRPLFFDLALNHVEMPSLDDKLEQKKAAGGLTGMVKGWLWGGKK
ncbi:signal recognition particle subunit SRP68-like [Mercenaria mercenaria]|uniref:signal recognition particle subunit SRP68-like n=1 Tax=Mercenaria mercenaria TaxID=6596 RepID=UPI00234EC98C|nr:signal recognition particle subunit SRP68-like [Mercenaria mercenaria]